MSTLDPIAIATIGYVCDSVINPIARGTHGYICPIDQPQPEPDRRDGDGGTGAVVLPPYERIERKGIDKNKIVLAIIAIQDMYD